MSYKWCLSVFFLLFIATSRAARHNNYIVGGQNAAEGQVPYQISLQTLPGNHLCGGAIIANNWILTAGHCVFGWPAELLRVATGSVRYTEPQALYYTDAIYLHCNYRTPAYHNDIALLHLNTSIVYNEQTQAVPLANKAPKAIDGEVIFSGWGARMLWDDTPIQLQVVEQELITGAVCAQLLMEYDDVSVDAASHLCTHRGKHIGACHGDSGGPLVQNGTLIGILNFFIPCATGVPDMYSNVRYYYDWMRQVMSGNLKCTGQVYPQEIG